MSPLYQELHRWAGLPFIWGESDCVLCLGDWIARVRGVDPFAEVRGTYDSMGSCQRETGFFRSPVETVDRHFAAIGLARTDAPVAGDVGVLIIRDGDGRFSPVGGLCLGAAWGFKGRPVEGDPMSGVATRHAWQVPKILATWGVGYAA